MMRQYVLGLLCMALMIQGNVHSVDNRNKNSNNKAKVTTQQPATPTVGAQAPSEYQAKDFSHLIGMKGFSDKLLNMHFTLYQGYVKNANVLNQKLRDLANEGKDKTPEYAGLKRMFGWEFDGMRLHDYYFGNLGGDGKLSPDTALYNALVAQYGSYDKWKADFVATGMIRGIGWAVLYYDGDYGRLTNTWINEHNLGHLAGNVPIITMDVFEHAYMPEYGLDRGKYIEAYFDNIDWKVASDRFNKAVSNAGK